MNVRTRRLVAGAAGVATVAAVSAITLAALPASAGNAPRLSVSATSLKAAAGTCTVLTVTPTDTFGVASSKSDTVTVTIAENPNSATQDVDFCTVPGESDLPAEDPSYTNGADFDVANQGASVQSYKAGPGITGNGSTSGGNPDSANNASQPAPNSKGDGGIYSSTNPTGVDRARYTYVPGSGGIKVGVVGLTSGGAAIKAFFDDGAASNHAGNYTPDSDETQAPTVTYTITAGGQPGSAEAAAAVTSIDVTPSDGVGAPNSTTTFTVTLKNSAGDTVRGVTPRVQMAANGANPNASPVCGETGNNGVTTCTFTGINPGTDVLTFYVNRAGGTAALDSGEVSKSVTWTTTKQPVAAAEARYLVISPKPATTTAGQSRTFTATVTDVNGAPAQNVGVTFTETGPGQFSNSSSTVATSTDATGRAFAQVDTTAGQTGTETVVATISTAGTQCSQGAGAGNGATATTPAGQCSDSTTNTVTAASPSPSPSTASPSPSVSTSPAAVKPHLSTSTPDIEPNIQGILDATSLKSNATYELRCYSRPNTDYFTARTATTSASASSLQFKILPGTNTRCYVRPKGDEANASNSVVINVHTTLSLSAYRDGVRIYHFQGTNLPRRAGQLITLYRWARADNNGYCDPHVAENDYTATSTDPNCVAIRTAIAKTDSSNVWRIDRTFTGSGQFVFMAKSGQNLTNAAGVSNLRLTIIH